MTRGISTKQDGQMKLLFKKITPEVFQNRQAFLNSYGLDIANTISADLIHDNQVNKVSSENAGHIIPECDALITQDLESILTITVADCLPLYFYDAEQKAVGLAHAGWRGVLKEIAITTLKALQENFGSRPEAVEVFIGPRLQACHFEVKDDVQQKFSQYLHANNFSESLISPSLLKTASSTLPTTSSHQINLAGIVSAQLQQAGVPKSNIQASQDCTFDLSDKYFSYRRDKPETIEAQLAFITLT